MKLSIKFIYFFFKLFPTNNKKVTFISRQSNKEPLDFILLKSEVIKLDNNFKVVSLYSKIESSVIGYVKYYLLTLRQMFHLATSKMAVIDSYCLAVSVLKHKKNLKVIQIWHAIATVKKFGYQTLGNEYGRNRKIAENLNMHSNYDYVISGSKAMSSVFSETFNTDIKTVKNIGTPRVDYLLRNCDSIDLKIKNKYPNLTKKKVILYAPTFRKDKKINIDNIVNTVDFSKYNLIVKTHPTKLQKFKNKSIYNCKEFSSLQLLSVSDYVITDYSAISIEASILLKKVYFYLYDLSEYMEKNGLNIDLQSEMKGYCFSNFEDLYKKIEQNTYDINLLKNFRDKYVDNQSGTSTYILAYFIVYGVWIDK